MNPFEFSGKNNTYVILLKENSVVLYLDVYETCYFQTVFSDRARYAPVLGVSLDDSDLHSMSQLYEKTSGSIFWIILLFYLNEIHSVAASCFFVEAYTQLTSEK